jgi:hypothetical protein
MMVEQWTKSFTAGRRRASSPLPRWLESEGVRWHNAANNLSSKSFTHHDANAAMNIH